MMPTEIYCQTNGRGLSDYDLLGEVTSATGMSRREVHDSVHALLDQLIDLDGSDAVIIGQRPVCPELEAFNPNDLDRDVWLTISASAVETIRESLIRINGE